MWLHAPKQSTHIPAHSASLPSPPDRREKPGRRSGLTAAAHPSIPLSRGVPSRSRRDKKLQTALGFLLRKGGECITCWVSHSRGGSPCPLGVDLHASSSVSQWQPPKRHREPQAPRGCRATLPERQRGYSPFSSPALSCLSPHGLSD